MSQGSSTVPPPPTGNPQVDIQGTGNGGGMDRIRGLISRLSGGGTPAIDAALKQHHDRTVALASGHANRAKQIAGWINQSRVPGFVNPETGKPVTPEDVQNWNHQVQDEWAQYAKIAGASKEAKPIIQKVGGLLGHVLGHPGLAGGKAGGQGQGQGTAGGGATSQPTQQGTQTVSPPPQDTAAPQATVPPVPTSWTGTGLDEIVKQQDARRIKDQEYRDKLAAEADPKYHTNEFAQYRKDLKEAFPEMSDDDIQKAALTKAGVIPKGAGKEMQPDFKDGMLVGVKDPATNSYYTDPEKMPPEAKAIYESAKKVEKAHQDEVERKENDRFVKQLALQTAAIQAAIEKSDYTAARKEVNKAKGDYESAIDRQDTMHKNLEAAKKGDQQAMLSLVANHIGMTLGAQKGARITRAVWDEATQSAPALERVKAKFDDRGYLTGVVLTPDQMEQMVRLGDEKVDTLKKHVSRVQEDYADELSVKRPRGKTVSAPPDGKSKRIKVTAEDMANAK